VLVGMGNFDLKHVHAARPEFSRDINRRLLLNLIRTRQPLSRADLARVSGLARATVSTIIQQLIAEGWVTEGPTGRLPLGRRPRFLKLNDQRMIVGVDLTQREATVALSDLTGHFCTREAMTMSFDRTAATAQLIAGIGRIVRAATGKTIEGIGICLQDHRCAASSRTSCEPNSNWPGPDVPACIAEATGLAVDVDTAANACALATAWFDTAEDWRGSVVVSVSEGIDAGIIANGELVHGRNGMAGDFGHVQLDPDGPGCECGGRGCWAVFASNRAALRYYSGPGAQSDLGFLDLLNLADRGDTSAAKALETMAYWLGRGFRMIIAGLAPDCISVVGDLTRSWERLSPALMAGLTAHPFANEQIPHINCVRDGGAARLRGALALVLQRRFAAWQAGSVRNIQEPGKDCERYQIGHPDSGRF
jgi:predicted NBD/HSP70 family sugar kinase